MSRPLELKAYAKVNLGLDIIRRREDGYHEVRMVMQTVKLFDLLTMKQNDSGEIHLSTNLPYLPTNEKNLVYRAIDMIRQEYKIREGVDVNLLKHIPVAAGMAGGSSDAAAAFVGMNQLFGLDIPQKTLLDYGVKLGADIPYCIMRGTALSEGIGEILTPLPSIPMCWFLIVKPTFSISTKYAYENLHLSDETRHPDIDGMVTAIRNQYLPGITSRMGNVLEDVVIRDYPKITEIKETMLDMGAMNSLMSGSGSTVFGIYTSHDKAMEASRTFKLDPDIRQVHVVRPFCKNLT
ncbi:MAG: 4-(cytidine 5'-diphospho)-2-C-methyl-D-erythritol kinase [Eubacterium sp.]|nr:4-(cytidine 5'-diphospho)-2-C-methyl-D-erythritol kinase [Eubacterium sp.]